MNIKHLFLGLAAVLIGGCASIAPQPTAPAAPALQVAPKTPGEVRAMLWVGNSFFYYNNSMHGHVGQLMSAVGVRGLRSVSATISGSGINWHDVAAHFKPGGVASYSFVGDNEVRFNQFDKTFDAVLMMDCSQCPVHPQLQSVFYEFAKKHSDTVRKNGAEPALFMSWAYSDKPEMTQQLANEYIKAGKQNNALVVPAGLAFANSIAKRPDINLYVADKRHPSLAGTYLGAAVVMASVYKRNPISNSYTAGLPADVATHLQNVAWETVQAFHAKEGRGSL
ncbi:MAG: hypothetical protein EAZ21_15280 [Betaproteobacteria bacterium]|nr:MAG: hypothetical protein EAZ21_15280 [Betaproteobacteria bacterium]